MPIKIDPSTPPPVIGKIGPYTVFMTPPPTPKPADPVFESPKMMVQPPPLDNPLSDGFFRNAVTKVQDANSRLDEHLARWFGLNQSKYQWALDDYYQTKGKDKELSSKARSV